MTIYDSELNPYASIDDYTLDGLYTPLVEVEKQEEDKNPRKVTVDSKPKKVVTQRTDSKNSLDSKDMFINPNEEVTTTSVYSKDTKSESVKASEKSKKDETEEVSKKDETKAEKPSEGVTEPPKRKRGRPRKVDIETPKEDTKDSE